MKFFLLLALLAFRGRSEDEEESTEERLTVKQIGALHRAFDGDGNGKVSMAEVLAFSAEVRKTIAKQDVLGLMEETDADKDGKMSLAELLKSEEEGAERADSAYQQDAEARVALETKKFAAADADKNGLLEKDELTSFFFPENNDVVLQLTAQANLEARDADKDQLVTAEELYGTVHQDQALNDEEMEYFKKLDKDGSGKLDLQELLPFESGVMHTEESLRSLFEIADSDTDGHITVDEFQAARDTIPGTDAQYHLDDWAEHLK